MTTRLLNQDQVRSLIDMPAAIEAVEEAFRAFNAGQVEQPPYTSLHLPPPRGEIDFKLGLDQAGETISLKISSGGFHGNPATHGLPPGMGTILLFDARTGALACVMDGGLITGLRTGAAGALSVRLLARQDAGTVAVIGTGKQARMQIRGIREVRAITAVHAWDQSPDALASFQADITRDFGIPVVPAPNAQQAIAQADILVTTTRGQGDLVQAGWVRPGTHIVAIGTDARGKQELDPAIFRSALIVHDSTAQCIDKGETWHPLQRGIIGREDIHAELGEILLGRKPGRQTAEQITLFDSTGMAIQDNTTARRILHEAVARGIGTPFDFFTP